MDLGFPWSMDIKHSTRAFFIKLVTQTWKGYLKFSKESHSTHHNVKRNRTKATAIKFKLVIYRSLKLLNLQWKNIKIEYIKKASFKKTFYSKASENFQQRKCQQTRSTTEYNLSSLRKQFSYSYVHKINISQKKLEDELTLRSFFAWDCRRKNLWQKIIAVAMVTWGLHNKNKTHKGTNSSLR